MSASPVKTSTSLGGNSSRTVVTGYQLDSHDVSKGRIGIARYLSRQNLAEQRHEGSGRRLGLCYEVLNATLLVEGGKDHFLERSRHFVRRANLATASTLTRFCSFPSHR